MWTVTGRDLADELAFLRGPVLAAAPRLLGSVISHGEVAVRLTEVEAYDGSNDPGSHAYRGQTARNSSMFGPAGHLYCYFSYGMHVCCNVVCAEPGVAAGVLLRAGEVIEGAAVARVRRNWREGPEHGLARGPANLARSLGITLDHDGEDLRSGSVSLRLGPPSPAPDVCSGPRVGLRGAPERPWRFWLRDEPSVSAYRPASRKPEAPRF